MQVFETNSALGYQELAYLIHINGDMYLVVDRDIDRQSCDSYLIGEVEEMEPYQLKESSYDLKNSPLWDSFLFQTFIKTLK